VTDAVTDIFGLAKVTDAINVTQWSEWICTQVCWVYCGTP